MRERYVRKLLKFSNNLSTIIEQFPNKLGNCFSFTLYVERRGAYERYQRTVRTNNEDKTMPCVKCPFNATGGKDQWRGYFTIRILKTN